MSEIYLKQGDAYVAMNETLYEEEKILQELIEQHPEMLAGEDAPHSALILVKREAGVSRHEDGSARWSLDHLYLDATGTPTLVEVKRSTDTRSRREVVAQMLDYAAHASVSFSADKMAAWLEEAARKDGRSASDLLREDLHVDDPKQFWRDVDTNLKAERFRLIFVADRIGQTLRRIIEFLNSQMTDTEVLAIEVKQYTDVDGRHQTIVPKVVGDTASARAVKHGGSQRQKLDREELIAGFAEHSPGAASAAAGLLDWAEQDNRLKVRFMGTGCALEVNRRPLLKLSLWWGAERSLEVTFGTLSELNPGHWDEGKVEDLKQKLGQMNVSLGEDGSGHRHPKAPLESLADEEDRRRFEAEMERVLATLS